MTALLLNAALVLASADDAPNGYTDAEAAKFAEALKALDKEFEDGKKKRPTTIEGYFELLKIDAKKLPKPSINIGNATDFHSYKLSPKWELVASYTQLAPKEEALRLVGIRGPLSSGHFFSAFSFSNVRNTPSLSSKPFGRGLSLPRTNPIVSFPSLSNL